MAWVYYFFSFSRPLHLLTQYCPITFSFTHWTPSFLSLVFIFLPFPSLLTLCPSFSCSHLLTASFLCLLPLKGLSLCCEGTQPFIPNQLFTPTKLFLSIANFYPFPRPKQHTAPNSYFQDRSHSFHLLDSAFVPLPEHFALFPPKFIVFHSHLFQRESSICFVWWTLQPTDLHWSIDLSWNPKNRSK